MWICYVRDCVVAKACKSACRMPIKSDYHREFAADGAVETVICPKKSDWNQWFLHRRVSKLPLGVI